MEVRQLTSNGDLKRYDGWLRSHPQGTLWQSLERQQYVESLGQQTRLYVAENDSQITASALVVIDKTAFGFSTWEIPHGPIWAEGVERGALDYLLEIIISDARKNKCFAFYISPINTLLPTPYALRPSHRHVYPEATRLIDLRPPEAEILKQMKQKGRYNIRVAEKHGVQVKESTDIDSFYRLVSQTSGRDGFTALPKKNYQSFLNHLPGSFLLLAYSSESSASSESSESSQNPIAGLLGVIWNGVGIYYYGASDYAYRPFMAPYALQWAAMQRCKTEGCHTYDLLGVAPLSPLTPLPKGEGDAATQTAAAESPPPSRPAKPWRSRMGEGLGGGKTHPWAGITAFKEQFGGQLITHPPEQMIVLRPGVKRLLDVKRRLW